MLKKVIYKDIEISQLLSGWWSALHPNAGYLKADTLGGCKALIDAATILEQDAEKHFFKSHPELNP